MTKGQLGSKADQKQARIENALAILGSAIARINHDSLRVRQAIRREPGLRDLLTPVLEDHRILVAGIRNAQAELRAVWDDGQVTRWK